tara:strand:- start:1361 stop:4219 length:2859 start_codon:yes stop_codon:yes gene_type:complete
MSTKELKIIDLNLLSGSSETTRTTFGSFYETVSGTYGEALSPIYQQESENYQEYFDNHTGDVSGLYVNLDLEETISDEIIIPNKKFPVRAYPNQDNIKDDNFWRTIWLGGKWGTSSYEAIYTDAVFDDHSFEYSLPYSQQEVNNIYGGSEFTDVIQATYTYNRYLAEYQDYVAALDSELLIPNMYLLKSYEQYKVDEETGASYAAADEVTEAATETAITLSGSIINFVTCEGNVLTEWDSTYFDFPTDIFDSNNVALGWNSLLLENDFASTYLTSSLKLYPLSSSTIIEIENILKNIMFDNDGVTAENSPYNTIGDTLPNSQVDFDGDGAYGSDEDSASEDTHGLAYTSKIPYYITVNFDTWRHRPDDEASYVDSIVSNNFSQKFLKTLKEAFLEEDDDLALEEATFAVESSYYSASADSASVTYYDVTSTDNATYRSIDYLKMLTYAHKNYISTTNNCYYIGGESYNRSAVFDQVGVYRHDNARNSMGVIEDVVDWLNNEDNFGVSSMWDLYNDPTNTSDFLGSKYYETLAYRVEKIGGEATGDSPTQNVLQNFWFFNPNDISNIALRDSQVKYGENYTYNVYAYVLTVGVKYNFSDLRLTRQIGAFGEAYACLEFYDPKTALKSDQLAVSWENNYLSGTNSYASNAQVIATDDGAPMPFLADFYLNYEPNLKLVEIPMFSKTLKVLDNPPNTFDVNPYQVDDNSQTVGFSINYETFYEAAQYDAEYDSGGMTYPTPISTDDQVVKSDYLHGRDLMSGSYQSVESVSRQRYFEAYRLDEKPTSISDFDGNQIATIDLRVPSTKYTYSSADFRDRIKTNKKYYYLFRFVNEQGIPGQLSEIYETELVNDGGYNYAVFNILLESDLGEEVFINPVKPFKKVIQLQPNVSQLLLNSSEADFDNFAIDEAENISVGSADDPIWDQTFKLRLTSKKTGKKIDLNITYKVDSQYDST